MTNEQPTLPLEIEGITCGAGANPFDVEDVPSLDFLRDLRLSEVSPRERDVVRRIATGLGNREIARALGISPFTLRHHITNIRRKLHIARRRDLIAFAVRTGLVGEPAPAGGAASRRR